MGIFSAAQYCLSHEQYLGSTCFADVDPHGIAGTTARATRGRTSFYDAGQQERRNYSFADEVKNPVVPWQDINILGSSSGPRRASTASKNSTMGKIMTLKLTNPKHHLYTNFLTFNKPFIDAEASNTYDSGANPMFGAKRALDPGGGYWVSDGQHGKEEVISIQASLKHRHRSNGVRINWAYAPGMVRVRVSSDGKHFSDSVCWTKTTVPDESYEQVLEFDRPRNIMAVRIDMKQPRSYKYFGINQMSLR
ncbi:unnamed protein product [Amoebophrya sp. A120]|nr:unnamed protein product [Amoebophrya sp. A120]|eukprot:GSA120T00009477001.1